MEHLQQYKKYTGKKKAYTRSYNKKEKVVHKVKVDYLSGKKINPFGESHNQVPYISVSSTVCYIFSSYEYLSQLFLHYQSLRFPILADHHPPFLSSTLDELKQIFTATQRVALLKCLKIQEDQYITGYVLYRSDWVETEH
jgi:hypothetical protein